MAVRTSGECPFLSVTSPTMRSGSLVRYERVALPGKRMLVRLGSFCFPLGLHAMIRPTDSAGTGHTSL